jgi:hydrogenase expression/formation protein HypD
MTDEGPGPSYAATHMKHVSEYRDPLVARRLVDKLHQISTKPARLMEVCGTHTVAIAKHGIRRLMPPTVRLLSGPGCPVCVTANEDIDMAIEIARQPGVIMTTFGDMMKVPGSYSSLAKEKADGRDIRVIYSALDAIELAKQTPDATIVFLAVGFETTAPTIAASILEAERKGVGNFMVYAIHKTVPLALKALAEAGDVEVNGFIMPGHVSTIIGSQPYEFVARDYGIPCVIAGFEPLDILQSIYMLVAQIEKGEAKVEIEYRRGVLPQGNVVALETMAKVFEPCDAIWRGIGLIPGTGLAVRPEYARFDAARHFVIMPPPVREIKGCQCGEVLRGVKYPYECRLFGTACTPEDPVGPCMVSSEGSCAAYYRYQDVPEAGSAEPTGPAEEG